MTQPTNHSPSPKHSFLSTRPAKWPLAFIAGLLLAAWLLITPSGFLAKSNAIGYAICHQIAERTFQVNGQPISLCARCTGMYLGAVTGLITLSIFGKRKGAWPKARFLILPGLAFLAFAVDGTNSAANLILHRSLLYTPTNTLRLITGMGMGVTLALIVLPTFHQTVWRDYDDTSAITSWKQLGILLAISTAVVLLTLTQQSFILLPFSVISAAGVVIMLLILYTMIILTIFNKENQFTKYNQLIPWLLAGFIIALLHIGLIDIGRFVLTGTWEGFHFTIG